VSYKSTLEKYEVTVRLTWSFLGKGRAFSAASPKIKITHEEHVLSEVHVFN
jgi:hypothetical protein